MACLRRPDGARRDRVVKATRWQRAPRLARLWCGLCAVRLVKRYVQFRVCAHASGPSGDPLVVADDMVVPDDAASPQPPRVHAKRAARALALAKDVEAAGARLVPPATCLEKALLLWCLVRTLPLSGDEAADRDARCCIRLGMRADGKPLEGHAWVEWQGLTLAPQEALHPYRRFAAAVVPSGFRRKPSRR